MFRLKYQEAFFSAVFGMRLGGKKQVGTEPEEKIFRLQNQETCFVAVETGFRRKEAS